MSSVSVEPARRRGLADEVADRIRDAIFDGVYGLGQPLREVELATALGVSRGPVREALLRLEREGLVSSVWHRGTAVATLSDDDLVEIDTLRDALEALAVSRVVSNATDDDLDAITMAADRMRRVDDANELVRCDIAFHDAVYAAARHRRLDDAWSAIRSQVQLFLLTRVGASTEHYFDEVRAEHQELAAALRARDLTAALELFARHRQRGFAVITTERARPEPTVPRSQLNSVG